MQQLDSSGGRPFGHDGIGLVVPFRSDSPLAIGIGRVARYTIATAPSPKMKLFSKSE